MVKEEFLKKQMKEETQIPNTKKVRFKKAYWLLGSPLIIRDENEALLSTLGDYSIT